MKKERENMKKKLVGKHGIQERENMEEAIKGNSKNSERRMWDCC